MEEDELERVHTFPFNSHIENREYQEDSSPFFVHGTQGIERSVDPKLPTMFLKVDLILIVHDQTFSMVFMTSWPSPSQASYYPQNTHIPAPTLPTAFEHMAFYPACFLLHMIYGTAWNTRAPRHPLKSIQPFLMPWAISAALRILLTTLSPSCCDHGSKCLLPDQTDPTGAEILSQGSLNQKSPAQWPPHSRPTMSVGQVAEGWASVSQGAIWSQRKDWENMALRNTSYMDALGIKRGKMNARHGCHHCASVSDFKFLSSRHWLERHWTCANCPGNTDQVSRPSWSFSLIFTHLFDTDYPCHGSFGFNFQKHGLR